MYNKQHMRDILNRLTLIGSRAWGGKTDKSDYDFIASTKIESTVFDILDALDIDCENYTGYEGNNILFNKKSVKFVFDGKIVNILFYCDNEYPKIDLVASAMKSLSLMKYFDEEIKNKYKRHRLFEKLVYTAFGKEPLNEEEYYQGRECNGGM